MSRKNLLILGGFVLLSAALVALIAGFSPQHSASGKLPVTASFYPMAEFTRQVGGGDVDVTTLTKPGAEPHDYDPAPGDLAQLYRSKLFIYNGAGLEPWVGRLQTDLQDHNVLAIAASDGLTFRADDPHVWLDPVLAAKQVDRITTALAEVDPPSAQRYHDRATAYKAKLTALDAKFRAGLANCSRRDIITAHDAFGYMAARYNLNLIPIAGLSPEAEPTPGQLAEIARVAREKGIKHIFFETLTSPKLADTLARETGAQTLVLNPLEGLTAEEAASGEDYISVQEKNLSNLRIALDCK